MPVAGYSSQWQSFNTESFYIVVLHDVVIMMILCNLVTACIHNNIIKNIFITVTDVYEPL